MELNFKENKYQEIALNIKFNEENIIEPSDAFFLLINNYDYESLNNLCTLISKYYQITDEESYKLTQNLNLDKEKKQTIFNLANECIINKKPLGTKLVCNNKFNATSWISHCMNVGIVSSNLANLLGINKNVALTLGLLHDYGRRKDQSFNHVIEGFQSLVDLNLNNEAIVCLTHSFLNGGRCCNNEPAINGFYVDEEGNPNFYEDTKKDDLTIFLERYNYTDYDLILNIADLMATSDAIVSPYERIEDIATRRKIDPTNRRYFLAELTNILIDLLKRINCFEEDFPHIKANKDTSQEEIELSFKVISLYFYETYLELTTKNNQLDESETIKEKEPTTNLIKKLIHNKTNNNNR